MSTSNATRPTKTKAGAPNHCNQLKNLKEDHAALQNKHGKLQLSFGSNLGDLELSKRKEAHTARELRDIKKDYIKLLNDSDQLVVEACRSIDNLNAMKYYKRSARCWCGGFAVLALAVITFPMWGL